MNDSCLQLRQRIQELESKLEIGKEYSRAAHATVETLQKEKAELWQENIVLLRIIRRESK